MKQNIAIEAENLGKRYWMRGAQENPTLFGMIRNKVKGIKPKEFWAIREATFSVQKGQTVGIIGPNGAGKSSTLGLVAGTITPTTGTVRSEGRIASLLELGAGFHSDLSGRENVYLNASLLGIPREDVTKRFDHIVGFAGLEEFIDMPVRNYSSGMYVRLGFAVATEVNPDILLIDEVLAVGDADFQAKCLGRIRDFQKKGKSLLFVTHALDTVEEYCHEVILVESGNITDRGIPERVIAKYTEAALDEHKENLAEDEHGTGDITLKNVTFRDENEQERETFSSGSCLHIDIEYMAKKRVENPVFGYSIKSHHGWHLFGGNTQIADIKIDSVEGPGVVRITMDPLVLRYGHFILSVSSHSWDHSVQYHRIEDQYEFFVSAKDIHEGIIQLNPQYELRDISDSSAEKPTSDKS